MIMLQLFVRSVSSDEEGQFVSHIVSHSHFRCGSSLLLLLDDDMHARDQCHIDESIRSSMSVDELSSNGDMPSVDGTAALAGAVHCIDEQLQTCVRCVMVE